MVDLRGKSVLITGATRGLGFSFVQHFAREGCLVTRVARQEPSQHRIRVSTFCPAVIATDMVGDFQKDPRCLQPDDLAETVMQFARLPESIDMEDLTVRSTNWAA